MEKKIFRKTLLLLIFVFCLIMPSYKNVCAAANVGQLSIVSDGSTKEHSYGVHAFLLYKNTSKSNQEIAGIKVKPNQSITIGTYGTQSDGKGVYVNLEAYYAKSLGAYADRVSLTTDISSSEFKTIKSKIDKCNKWSSLNNCSWFAKEVWNTVVPKSKKLSAGTPSTPKTLSKNIKKDKSYKKKINLPTVKNTNVYRYNKSGKVSSSSPSSKKNSFMSH